MHNEVETTRPGGLAEFVSRKIVGQPGAIERIVPYIKTHQAGLTPEGRPIAVFLLLGPTGTGKTRTVEVLAEALHGSQQRYVRIDCGEYQSDHEVAKLIGSPPGYLGHRETVPALSKQKIAESTTPDCDISLILFDEIEKAAPSLNRLLLGVLDKARLTLGDNSTVNFEKSLIFLTSNLGAGEMMRELNPGFGFEAVAGLGPKPEIGDKLENIAMSAVKKRFSPEFVNRIDAVITYQPLSRESISLILDAQLQELQNHVHSRLGSRGFTIEITPEAKEFLLDRGVTTQYGARELKRVVHRYLTQPLATLVAENRIPAGAQVTARVDAAGEQLHLDARSLRPASVRSLPSVLIVDDNEDLLKFLKAVMRREKWNVITANSGEEALELADQHAIEVGLIDYVLPDLDGVDLSLRLRDKFPGMKAILMSGGDLTPAEQAALGADTPLIQKPFLFEDILTMIRSRMPAPDQQSAATAG